MSDASRVSGRFLAILVVLAAVVVVATLGWTTHMQSQTEKGLAGKILARMLSQPTPKLDNGGFVLVDADGDLVADTPAEADQLISPDPLVFSYVAEMPDPASAAPSESDRQAAWQALLDALAEGTGHHIQFAHFDASNDQLAAFRERELHITALNTGAVPAAVERCGFVPLCTLGQADGSYGYTMKIIVPASSDIKSLADLRRRKITFTNPNSNSGFKAAFTLLMDEQGMLPERDYQWILSGSHDLSIQRVAAGKTDAAPVASDMLARAIATGEVDGDSIRTIYESERFPPATIGVPYNLDPELRKSIEEVLVRFDWQGTPLEAKLGPMNAARFVAVNYKDDWANTRRIDQSIERVRTNQ